MDNHTLLSSFGKWLAPICTKMFTTAVAECQPDKYTKKLTTTAYLKLFLLAQLQCREGLRHIADDVLCEDLQHELGLTSISASQLSRKHKQVDPELLQQVFESLARLVLSRQGIRSHRHKIKIIDSTTVNVVFAKVQMGGVPQDESRHQNTYATGLYGRARRHPGEGNGDGGEEK
jgi:hypothetical protein